LAPDPIPAAVAPEAVVTRAAADDSLATTLAPHKVIAGLPEEAVASTAPVDGVVAAPAADKVAIVRAVNGVVVVVSLESDAFVPRGAAPIVASYGIHVRERHTHQRHR
jgi:hypothetical protein